jgi:hypothetical protein
MMLAVLTIILGVLAATSDADAASAAVPPPKCCFRHHYRAKMLASGGYVENHVSVRQYVSIMTLYVNFAIDAVVK